MKTSITLLLLLCVSSLFCQRQPHSQPVSDAALREMANRLAKETIIIDTHIDLPERLQDKMEDISVRTEGGEFDYVRAKEGGVDAPFMSIYVPASFEQKGGGKVYADKLIDMVEGIIRKSPEKFAAAYSVEDVRNNFKRGIISLPMGMENGTPIEGKLGNIRYFFDRGIRYITLAHSKSNHISDSSYDEERKWNGLSPFGKEVVMEMNRLGIMVDVSHVSDSAFYQILRVTKAPVIASHSSCRHFTPGWERNMDDDMIKALGANGGVIQINFGSDFLSEEIKQNRRMASQALRTFLKDNELTGEHPRAQEFRKQYSDDHPRLFADVKDVVAHIDHVVSLVGVDHVGFGSDFDGVGDSLPTGLKDVSYYPNLLYELLKAGYTADDVRKICSGNTLRVWSGVEQIAREFQTSE